MLFLACYSYTPDSIELLLFIFNSGMTVICHVIKTTVSPSSCWSLPITVVGDIGNLYNWPCRQSDFREAIFNKRYRYYKISSMWTHLYPLLPF